MSERRPLVGVLMGSKSDWETVSHTVQTLEALGLPHEVRVLSAHRAPDAVFTELCRFYEGDEDLRVPPTVFNAVLNRPEAM